MEPTKVYRLKDKSINWLGIACDSGQAADGDTIQWKYVNDYAELVEGNDGSAVVNENPNGKTIEVTINLLQTSRVFALFSAAIAAAEASGNFPIGPFMCKDSGGSLLLSSVGTFPKKLPDGAFGKTAQTRSIVLTGIRAIEIGGGQ